MKTLEYLQYLPKISLQPDKETKYDNDNLQRASWDLHQI